MKLRALIASVLGSFFVLSFAVASASTGLSVSCAGAPSDSSIVWTGSATDGIAPVALLWGNGSTSTVQTVSVAPGTYSMTLQATDASSTVATTTCSAAVASPSPVIASFTATPSTIVNGQSAVLSWSVSNASSTSISGVGAVSGTSLTVSPVVTTTYQLSAVNPAGVTTASALVTVQATTTSGGSDIAAQIQALLDQIAQLRVRIAELLLAARGITATSTPPITGNNGEFCSNDGQDIHEGDNGDHVSNLQQMLAKDPAIYPEGLVTGFFGARTREAVKRLQEKFGIHGHGGVATGFIGPLTRSFFHEQCGGSGEDNQSSSAASSTPSIQLNSRGDRGGEDRGNGNNRGSRGGQGNGGDSQDN